METYYEHPHGYRPNAKLLARDGVPIQDMKKGNQFIASDGRKFVVTRPVKTTRCAGGVTEHDMWARPLGADTEYLFHCPVGANPLKYTYILCG